MPVIEHYERQGKLAKVSAVPPPNEASTFPTDAPVTCASCIPSRMGTACGQYLVAQLSGHCRLL